MALSAYVTFSNQGTDFQGGDYALVGASPMGVAAGVLVQAVVAGGRDRSTTTGAALAPAASVGSSRRALARLLGQWPAVALGVLYAVALHTASVVQGGHWIGDAPRWALDVVHGPFEVAQSLLLPVLAAVVGVAIGRASARPRLAAAVAGLCTAAFGFLYWARPGLWAVLSPLQVQPFTEPIGLPGTVDLDALPPDWYVAVPTPYEPRWMRVVLSQPLAAAHLVYLVGLGTMAFGAIVRGRRGRLASLVGAVVTVAGAAATWVAMPGW